MVDGAAAGRKSEANGEERFRQVLKMSAYRCPVTKGVHDTMGSSFGL